MRFLSEKERWPDGLVLQLTPEHLYELLREAYNEGLAEHPGNGFASLVAADITWNEINDQV